MSSNSYLDDNAEHVMRDAIYGMTILDMDELRDQAQEGAAQSADSACIYTHDCLDIISRYENDPRASDSNELLGGTTYTADKWQEAMTAYAASISRAVVEHDVNAALDAVEEAMQVVADDALSHGASDDVDSNDMAELRISRDCPYGFAVHAREDDNGMHYWNDVEGSKAVALRVSGVWLSYAWTPAS